MASSTLVAVGGKGSNPKTTLYVGGLEESVTEATLHAAFIPFGDLKDVNLPMDHATSKHRGFGFVEFEDKEDAAAAVDNMHNSELFGRVLRVNYAQPVKIKGGDKGWSHQPVWADADKYIDELAAEQELEAADREQRKRTAAAAVEAAQGGGGGGGDDPMAALEAAAAAGGGS
ncbi:peptidyl-prolyl cis-trans isomerase E [Raphidocelis subcapitata]|uniref:Peptidyl-prolyl cis-trans isomerase E n=1 Tax=Raphidocelis subcapitata TaxID=307507 RepID=A0A2V0NWA1_9CHLO|nr:peptidyl-prolyl cis-trans isomerase E [Raphidocelis subcapitata]|eukprot:GBF91609.1 peptidyl-prolyl cis-trans isomerase E [Raphidocelis subcapitata]